MNERRKMLAVENTVDTVALRVTTTDGSTNVGIEMVVTNGDIVYPVTTDSQGKVSLTGLSGGCTIDCETHELNVTEFYATGSMTVDISAWVNTFPVGEVRNYNYTGGVQQVDLIPGTYVLQVWGAQGGSGGSYAGGKGGYSQGVLTLTSPRTVYVFVGGQGSSSGNGGWNGGGGSSGSASYSSGGTDGSSSMGCGGGSTDIALVTSSMSYSSNRTNRTSASLLSRIIVAGGGSGGAYTSRSEETTVTSWETHDSGSGSTVGTWKNSSGTYYYRQSGNVYVDATETYRVKIDVSDTSILRRQYIQCYNNQSQQIAQIGITNHAWTTVSLPSSCVAFLVKNDSTYGASTAPEFTYEVQKQVTSSSTSTDSSSSYGYVGGGTSGGGYSSTYQGRQNAAGTNGAFGLGANQGTTNYRHCSGAGGGGWYGGGGGNYSDSDVNYCKYSGGGSGFVNIAANASYRPSGYTGLELDSGETKDGNTSFPNTAGTGNETGHAGNGYAKIARIAVLNITLRFKNEENEPVVNTSVTLTSGSDTHTSTTNANGEATFTVQNGTYSVSCGGYTLTPSQITVTKNQTFDFVAELPSVREYPYTGSVQQDTLPAGTYKIECWGAQGGYRSNASYGGKGGYSVGKLTLSQNTNIYVYVGGSGNTGGTSGGFNGGGTRATYAGGGGGSDVRIGQDSLYARVIVAGGGGSDGATSRQGMYGGGTTGGTTTQSYGTGGGGGTQTSGGTGSSSASGSGTSGTYGAFGVGGRGYAANNGYAGAGGGGWYGGAGSYPDGSGDDDRGGGGGSGYVYTSGTASNYPSGCLLDSSHYLTDAETKAGYVSFPSTSGGTETGHSGNGYIRITKV